MQKLFIVVFIAFVSFAGAKSQSLLPSIGIGPLPADTTAICSIPWYLGSFNTSGLQVGDTASDFTLYDLNGNAFNLAAALVLGKPVLLVSGSYTCPVFRNKINSINNVIASYGSQLTVAVIYCVEAHPTDTSPYFGYVNTTSANISAGILYAQPTTYGQRKQVVTDLLANVTLNAPVYIDGPCNNWWLHYGPAPNNAYLINTNGIVTDKHGWYDSFPNNIICDIDSLLGGGGGGCDSCSIGNGQQFSFNLLSNDTAYSVAGGTPTIDGEIINRTNSYLRVQIMRNTSSLAPGWAASMCATVCYASNIDSIVICIAPQDTQSFHYYFYSDLNPNTSSSRIRFKNMSNSSNSFIHTFWGITTPMTNTEEPVKPNSVKMYPNPAREWLNVSSDIKISEYQVYSLGGVLVHAEKLGAPVISLKSLPPGFYFIRFKFENGYETVSRFSRLE